MTSSSFLWLICTMFVIMNSVASQHENIHSEHKQSEDEFDPQPKISDPETPSDNVNHLVRVFSSFLETMSNRQTKTEEALKNVTDIVTSLREEVKNLSSIINHERGNKGTLRNYCDSFIEQVRLEKEAELSGRWIKDPVPYSMKIYLFNITNPSEFANGERPVLAQVGPYVYEQRRENVMEEIKSKNETISYRPKTTYYFRPDMSVGSESDELNFINYPYLSLATAALKARMVVQILIRSAGEDHDEKLFKKRTVGEFLFYGTHEPFVQAISEMAGEDIMPNNTFGIFYGKNGTTQDLREIYSGLKEIEKFGNVVSWKEQQNLSFWKTDYCNMINGSDGSIFPPFVSRDRVLQIFDPGMCRSISMKYMEDVEVHGIRAYKFAIPRDVLEDPRINSENECYCLESDGADDLKGCTKAGVLRIGACKRGSPIVVSWPHFYDGDQMYVNQSEGLSPNKVFHETFLSIEPVTGSLLEASKRIQLNMDIEPLKRFSEFRKLPPMMLPVMWVDESMALDEADAEIIKKKLLKYTQEG